MIDYVICTVIPKVIITWYHTCHTVGLTGYFCFRVVSFLSFSVLFRFVSSSIPVIFFFSFPKFFRFVLLRFVFFFFRFVSFLNFIVFFVSFHFSNPEKNHAGEIEQKIFYTMNSCSTHITKSVYISWKIHRRWKVKFSIGNLTLLSLYIYGVVHKYCSSLFTCFVHMRFDTKKNSFETHVLSVNSMKQIITFYLHCNWSYAFIMDFFTKSFVFYFPSFTMTINFS
jgi:hypothetical protein